MRRERSGDEGVQRGGSPASHSLRSRIHASLAEFFSLSLGACSQANKMAFPGF